MPEKANKLIVILGPTACGKTRAAALLSNKFNGEIISADSRQVYKHMNLGTGKDYKDYIVEGKKIESHLIDIIEPTEEYDLYHFQNECKKLITEINERGKIPFLVGGTGLYLASILLNYNLSKVEDSELQKTELMNLPHELLKEELKKINPKLHNTTDLTDKERTAQAIIVARSEEDKKVNEITDLDILTIGLQISKDEMKKKIKLRLQKRFDDGMIDEVIHLLEMNVTHEKLKFFGLEYFFISQFLQKKISYNDMFQKLNAAINNFAKRQMTWFRKLEREGIKINWIDPPYFENASPIINNFLKLS